MLRDVRANIENAIASCEKELAVMQAKFSALDNSEIASFFEWNFHDAIVASKKLQVYQAILHKAGNGDADLLLAISEALNSVKNDLLFNAFSQTHGNPVTNAKQYALAVASETLYQVLSGLIDQVVVDKQPDRFDFSNVVAAAYCGQYVDKDHVVMGNPQIFFDVDTGKFGSCSSLTPLDETQIIVLVLEEDIFGEWEGDVREQMARWLNEQNDDLWDDVRFNISTVLKSFA